MSFRIRRFEDTLIQCEDGWQFKCEIMAVMVLILVKLDGNGSKDHLWMVFFL